MADWSISGERERERILSSKSRIAPFFLYYPFYSFLFPHSFSLCPLFPFYPPHFTRFTTFPLYFTPPPPTSSSRVFLISYFLLVFSLSLYEIFLLISRFFFPLFYSFIYPLSISFPPDMIYSLRSFSYGIKYLYHGNIGIIVR